MCGIVAYVGRKIAQPLLIEGLKRLEYRGYDSAGIAVIDQDGGMHIRRAVGRISVLEDIVNSRPLPRCEGRHGPHALGHARRAHRGAMPIRTPTMAGASRWFTTASSKTTRR
jgi:glucosamine--fructose-6-phosphate aminotransferase (isomerizing)